uniref:Uncharacterized protein n=1 Tax=viral metagenome TaxID=1070528 RepID=A0A6C0DCL7_9ZZZZ
MILKRIVLLNGIYDILCAISILKIIHIPILSELHLSMIKKYDRNPLFERFFAYWIFTYGIIRIFGNNLLISLSYFVEAVFLLNEYMNNILVTDKALFVIVSSIILGILVFYTRNT